MENHVEINQSINKQIKDTQETLAAVEHGHSCEETSQFYDKHTDGHRQRSYQP